MADNICNADNADNADNACREMILKIEADITGCTEIKGARTDIVMVPFTGTASGKYFTGRISGTGVDTQKLGRDGKCILSARYMLEGTDHTGTDCRVFIENNTNKSGGLTPFIVTDSAALAGWEDASLSSEITPREGGVTVRIFKDK